MFEITDYQVTYKVNKPVIFTTYPGFYLRNALIKAMTRYCSNPNRIKDQKITNCHGCKFQPKCVYYSLHLPVEEPEGTPVPMPFLLDANNLIVGKYEQGEMSFTIRLFGNARIHANWFRESFEAIGKHYGLGEEGSARSIRLLEMKEMKLMDVKSILTTQSLPSERITLNFDQLKLPDKLMKTPFQLSAEKLFQLITGRVTELDLLYGNSRVDIQLFFPENNISNRIKSASRFSKCNYQYTGTGIGHYFLNGQVELTGQLQPVLNLLLLGSRVGIGRFTAYGFGTYSIHHE